MQKESAQFGIHGSPRGDNLFVWVSLQKESAQFSIHGSPGGDNLFVWVSLQKESAQFGIQGSPGGDKLFVCSTTHCADKLPRRGCKQIQIHTDSH